MVLHLSKATNKPSFQSLVRKFLIIKSFSISLFPQCPKKAQWGCFPHFFPFPSDKGAITPQQSCFYRNNTTQEIPKRDNKSPHSHNVEKCDQLTPIQQDKENIYLLIPILFSRADQELVLFPKAPPRQKIHALGGTHGFQTTHIGKGTDLLS